VKNFSNRGKTHCVKGEWDEVIADFTAVLTIKHSDPVSLYNRGCVYGCKGEYDRAIADFDKALELKPDFADALKAREKTLAKKAEVS
jgi:tetratricopeptide (TPR) repeat protein